MALFNNPKYKFLFFLALFFVINLLQSTYMGLLEDEAYYWVWSENLAWGYFDHPPMVALFIWLGGLVFEGELGVRFISAISFSLMLWFIWKTLDHKDKYQHVGLFFLLVVSLALLQVYGFISTPDTPLLLFTAIFFWAYKQFLSSQDTKNVLLLGIVMAALVYSKYHGVLIIGFAVLSNLALLLNKRFWMAAIFSLLLFVPHVLWQYNNGFPSFVYHLTERGLKPYRITHTLHYLLNALAIVGITFPVIYLAFYKKTVENLLERSLKFIVYGFFLFFLLTSFKSETQAQWLAAFLIPLCLLVFPYLVDNEIARKWLYRLGLIQLGIVILGRILLTSPSFSPVMLEPHLSATWIPELRKKTNGEPIVFVNSYRNASIYRFYTGINTHTFGIPRGRKSQYALLDTESKLQGKAVYGVGKQLTDRTFLVNKGNQKLFGYPIDPFISFQNLTCQIDKDLLKLQSGKETRISFLLSNPYDQTITFENTEFFGIFQGEDKIVLDQVVLKLSDLKPLQPKENRKLEAVFTVPAIKTQQGMVFRVGISFQNLPAGAQGNRVLVQYSPNVQKDQR